MQTIDEVLSEFRRKADKGEQREYVKDWKKQVPSDSQWFPGCPGDPFHTGPGSCQGTGYVRLDVPVGHKYFGKIVLCDCVGRMARNGH